MATTDKNLEKKLLLPYDVRCPKDTSKLQWLAMQTPAVIELSKDLYRQIRPFCTEKSCRKMAAGKYEYQWKHHARSKKPRSYPAQYYLKMMFQWINQQNHIFELENMRHNRLVSHMSEEDATLPVLHKVFRQRITLATMPNTIVSVIIADYLHDPFFHLTGIWAKGFSVFAHVFCQHFGDNELSAEVKTFVESAFERFMRFVKGYRILSNRRLAPLDKRIATIDFKTLNLGSTTTQRGERRRTASSITSPQSTLPRSEGDVAGSPSTSMLLEDGASSRTFSSLRLDPNDEQTPLITRYAQTAAETSTKPTHLKAQSAAVLPSIHEKKTSSHPTHKSTNFLESDRKDVEGEGGDKKDKDKDKDKSKDKSTKEKEKEKEKEKGSEAEKDKEKEESGGRPRMDSEGPGEDPNISDEERDEGGGEDDRLVQSSGGKPKSPGVDSTSGPVDGERPSTPEVLVGS